MQSAYAKASAYAEATARQVGATTFALGQRLVGEIVSELFSTSEFL
jgi:hypothetical protein